MIKRCSIKLRVLLAALEIVIGSGALLIFLVFISFMLVKSGQLSSSQTINFDLGESANVIDIKRIMDSQAYDYVVFNRKNKEILYKKYYHLEDRSDFINAAKTLKTVNNNNAFFRVFNNKKVILVVRQSELPEFKSNNMRSISYNHFSYLLFIIGEILIVSTVMFRLIWEFSDNFNAVKKVSLVLGKRKMDLPIRKSSRIIEFEDVVDHLEQKSDELGILIEKEKTQKKDLSFQIAALAHDVKTPLTVLKGNIELLESTDVSQQQQEFLFSMKKSLNTFDRYFNSMIDYSKLINDDSNYQNKLNLKKFIENIVPDIDGILKKNSIEFTLNNNSSKKDFIGNDLALSRAIINIIINATQHTRNDQHKRVIMNINDDNELLKISIWNNGKPFSNSAYKKGTKLFYTSDTSRSGEHYGLGLAFSNAIAIKHGGQLVIDNPLTGGATVSILIRN
ncbi:sensor histidine kinase [Leuconostoc gasicomitatum]|uniref:sensor histidine kinase n=1 Tax=Leuconostoc gasicomitatum TaxID=115778 RepID=UPI0015CE6871|nr:HAMP domain-containing sensor histidine kinase [Leuconostoc gasicomitatum]MBZ5943808.1 HAMP domain-containing histidine kinase [Leuconostoc gasicomitatum]MBZ5950326.1 HAMP domain-containing histidine kinase [Leuconostoc gasicomitatum]MBZ5951795.1 HAMP domain-containing histidine kinase [Leuconostoc gasicomitatum]MBZ5970665.1 HAMP domain-containing histidine kinase [Leuconostoc gasicomitatum]QLG78087.1 HAMP domain-containing histidine kinase [Leuconostoc gasicomitatum]